LGIEPLFELLIFTAVDNETISKYFENVLGADPPELSEEVLISINNDHFENVDVDALKFRRAVAHFSSNHSLFGLSGLTLSLIRTERP
jgi:hypothetical protein